MQTCINKHRLSHFLTLPCIATNLGRTPRGLYHIIHIACICAPSLIKQVTTEDLSSTFNITHLSDSKSCQITHTQTQRGNLTSQYKIIHFI
jgi:hypothetical protein